MATSQNPVTIDQIEALLNALGQRIDARFNTQGSEITLIANAVADLHVKFRGMESRMTGMESKMDAMAEDSRQLRAITQANTWDIAVIKGNVTVIATDIGETKNSLLRMETRFDVLERAFSTESRPAS